MPSGIFFLRISTGMKNGAYRNNLFALVYPVYDEIGENFDIGFAKAFLAFDVSLRRLPDLFEPLLNFS